MGAARAATRQDGWRSCRDVRRTVFQRRAQRVAPPDQLRRAEA